MNAVCIHIDEELNLGKIGSLKEELMHMPFINNVELNTKMPHDMMVEFDAHHNMPMMILTRLSRRGLHSDIMAC
ncbi:MAG: hypothetical protein BMS9Abin26_0008 [Gammaproteobacteria bacterium]|nr:MAG: hypothetical protein BMS9Abin26_0008 [Gammaproteobacteria bacterium]